MFHSAPPSVTTLVLISGLLAGVPAQVAGAEIPLAQSARERPSGEAPASEALKRKKYERCISLAKSNPDTAFDMALAWQDFGGGDAAGHCVAAALIGLKIYREAAYRLETLAQNSKTGKKLRAGMLAQAAQAWLLDNNLDRAESVLDAAIKLTPDDAKLYTDRGFVRAEGKRFPDAIKDLSHAIRLDPKSAEGYVFRASAYRHIKKFALAVSDTEQALRLDSTFTPGLLERGILRRLEGNDAGARADWMKILELEPNSEAAVSARQNLEKMDVKRK